ncbi:cytochrome b [Legionella rowbothamii]|uniref:cytochrome b n=1 Tax=Legionella rowbothamii TaxID=96229 RepID=UPI00105586BF|nr:cytochrome b [Legionella rowbothamii]
MLKNTLNTFGSMSKFFHWVIALLVCAQFYWVWAPNLMTISNAIKTQYVLLHKSFGVTILLLSILFIAWRMVTIRPSALYKPYWQHILAKIVHYSLFILLLAMPILGYLMAAADGRAVSFFGLFNLPNLISTNQQMADFYFQTHSILGYAFATLIGLHVAAALHHHLILKDDVLKKMLPYTEK